MKKLSKKKKVIIILIAVLLVALIAGLIMFFGLRNYADKKLDLIQYEGKAIEKINDTIVIDKGPSKGYRTIALFGIDSRFDDYEEIYRTDCLMFAVINYETREITLFSIYRDTFVEMTVNGVTELNKINQAYYGGVQNSLDTINKNLDLNITDYAMANFSSMSDIIDAIGGVDIDVDSEEIKYINNYIKDTANVASKPNEKILITTPGLQHLNGVQAMAYCRIRYTEGGDYKRTERMREVFSEAIAKIKKMSFEEIDKLIDLLLPEVRTNIPKSEIMGFLDMSFGDKFGWPYTTEGIYINNDFYGPPVTLESNVERLHKEVYKEDSYVVPESVKEISRKIVAKTGLD